MHIVCAFQKGNLVWDLHPDQPDLQEHIDINI